MASDRALHSRAINSDEVDQHFKVMCESFDLDQTLARPIYDSDPFYDLSHKRALFDGDQVVSVLTVIPSRYRLTRGVDVFVAAIAGVGTPPDLRGRGYASQLIAETIRSAPSDYGYPLAALVTDRPDYYKRFGFATCSTAIDWTASPADLPASVDAPCFQPLSPVQYAAASLEIHRFQDAATAATPGLFVRDERRWTAFEMMTPLRKVAAWPGATNIEAYVSYEEFGAPGSLALSIHEIVAPTESGRKTIMSFLAQQSDVATISGRVNRSQLADLGLDKLSGVRTEEVGGAMIRVLDLEDLLATIGQTGQFTEHLHGTDGLTLRANNAFVSSQNRPMRLFTVTDKANAERVALSPADEMEGHWIAADIGPLTQMLTGYRSASRLAEDGRLSCSSDEAVALADKMFLECDPFLGTPDTF